MDAVIGALRIIFGADTVAFEEGADKAIKTLNRAGRDLQATGKKIAGVGDAMSVGLTLPLVAFGTQAARAAIDAEEMKSAFNVSFGAMAADAAKWAETTGNALGRSTTEMQQGMLTMHGLFKAGGPATDQTRKLSEQFAVLAQDLSSFHNVSPEDALDRLRSGLSGEAEPLRKFNVYLTEAAVKAKAMQLGLVGLNGQVSESAKIQARAALIMEGTKEAQGDVLRTQNSTANQIRKSQAAWQELSVTVGTKLLPALTPLVETVGKLLESFNNLSPGTQEFIIKALAVTAALGPVLSTTGRLVGSFGKLLPMLTAENWTKLAGGAGKAAGALGTVGKALVTLALNPVFLTIAAIVLGIYLAWKYWDKIEPIITAIKDAIVGWWNDNVKPVFDAIGTAIGNVVTWFAELPNKVVGALTAFYTNVKTWLGDKVSAVWDSVKAAATRVIDFYLSLPGKVIEAMRALYTGVKLWLQNKLGAVFDWLRGKIGAVADKFKWLWDVTVGHSYVPDLFDGVAAEAERFQPEFVDPLLTGIGQVADAFEGMESPDLPSVGLPGAATGSNPNPAAPENRNEWVEGFKQTFTEGIKAALHGDLGGFFGNFFKNVGNRALDNILNSLTSSLGNILQGAVGGTGGGGGFGGLLSSAFGAIFGGGGGGGIPGFATGGSMLLGGRGGIDRNLLSLNGSPIARVSRGENLDIRPDDLSSGGGSAININFYGPVSNAREVRSSAAQAAGKLARVLVAGQRGV